ncbi:MAG: PAS domain-containing protein [Oscillospiraceae bacterium]|nr:PAS domain-containing protein [Oscillospiraceae bacterium]
MTDSQLHYFTKVAEFIGRVLGPDYEVALHDISDRDGALVAIANGHISGRSIGHVASDKLMHIIETHEYEHSDFILHQYGMSPNGRILCSSTMFIKNEAGYLIGALCINFDDSRYRELSQKVFNLCHPDALVDTNFRFDETKVPLKITPQPHRLKNAPDGSAHDIITAELRERGLNPENLSVKDKLQLILELDSKGVFLIKGAVKDAAEIFGCSQATMYRHLSKAKEMMY